MIVSIVGLVKAAAALGCLGGSWAVWRRMPSNVARASLSECFLRAGLYAKKNEAKLYPLIKSVRFYADRMQMVFALPVGLDPKDVSKAEYVFKQQFGEHVQLDKGVKVFTLNVYPHALKAYPYRFEDIKPDGYKLPIFVGKSRKGWECYDMVEHPHLLVSGETGWGKSTQLRSILTTLILSGIPMELYCADLKASEFHLFRGIAKCVETEPGPLKKVMKQLTDELKRRGKLLNEHEKAHIDDLPADVRPPYIILCIDEFALLKGETAIWNEVEKIGGTGRALGCFLILSCLRPDADVLDGKIKQCLTVRMCFRQDSELNSRIALGQPGAEQLEQKGLLLFKLFGTMRVQAPHLELEQAKKLLAPYKTKPPQGDVIDIPHEVVEEEVLGVLE